LVAGILELLIRKLVRLALDFLHGKYIGVGSLKPRNHSINAGANGIYVVGGDAHEYSLNGNANSPSKLTT
jgi:hypothetical protein